ncbi:metal ABC transporter ATP-binding protein [Streptomyces sp. Je 1-4]|uniref:metal ABC transporter ATP-binding protein n=1 Tax=Streptomyces TaxID=1883 RepID=UPI0021D8A8A9|nr:MULTISPECIES: metal ABC transporter ATP-binding protein [unclassified Streptomyces]UYB43990.1 metal ABC transporter ATP-binding protein [Streptomyces sp. Je 1-4]UZQ40418.1 metal ABC transporter ATP-binding protein [Streptomyces sp. Je 1-4] [Streptomyces sp. Je 1-4 4N24]UZQ47835.1 metal ABC transporter ATP-binding protein [Streptomyces sp. Je 1-4] [Streptomyces sp. Je 1-4 4N24_ara]
MDRTEAVRPLPEPGGVTGRGREDLPAEPVISLRGAALAYGGRVLWRGLDLDVRPGEFLAVVGPNGSGKTSLLRVLLGRQQLSEGALTVLGHAPRRGGRHIGYVPQQTFQPAHALLRARDLVRLGLDGHRWGLPLARRAVRRRVDDLLDSVGATPYADVPLGRLSGGEQQRIRIAQALATDPRILLCDEPLLSLDLHHQRTLTGLVEERRRSAGTAVVFVTHEINPVLGLVDRVLYLARGGHRVGPPDEVMSSTALSELYGTQVDVVRVGGRIVVAGVTDFGTGHTHADGADGGESP